MDGRLFNLFKPSVVSFDCFKLIMYYYVSRKYQFGSIKGFDNNVQKLFWMLLYGGKSVTIGADTYHPPFTKVCVVSLQRGNCVKVKQQSRQQSFNPKVQLQNPGFLQKNETEIPTEKIKTRVTVGEKKEQQKSRMKGKYTKAFYTHMHKCINTQEITVGMEKHTHLSHLFKAIFHSVCFSIQLLLKSEGSCIMVLLSMVIILLAAF